MSIDWTAAPASPGLKIKWADGWIEVFPEYEFTEDCIDRPNGIYMYKREEPATKVEYTLCVSGRTAWLDYGGRFEEVNSHQSRNIYIGVLRIDFADLDRTAVKSVLWREKGSDRFINYHPYVSWQEPKTTRITPFVLPNGVDRRKKATLSSVLRPGQMRFRRALLAAYGERCSVSRCHISNALEAAHIIPYQGPDCDHVQNGLLMRADLHRLFDMHLFSIAPGTFCVVLSKELRTIPEYAALEGQSLLMPTRKDLRPSVKALRHHWKQFKNVNSVK